MNTALPNGVRFGREICGDLVAAERREWWIANGLGAYAAGTVALSLTRRYHGLLIAPVAPPLGRHPVFAKADATLVDGTQRHALFTNRWAGNVVEPRGHVHIESFALEGRMPVWRFALGDVLLEQRIWMEPKANTSYVAWKLLDGALARQRPLELELTLLVNARDHHGTARPWQFNPVIEAEGTKLRLRHPNWFDASVEVRGGRIETRHDWYENFELSAETERGLDNRDSHLCPARVTLQLSPDEWVGLVVSTERDASAYLGEAMRRATAADLGVLRRAKVQVPELIDAPSWIDQLVLAADSFVFARPVEGMPDGESVIAGYPWFGDWGRDTVISLAGLTLATGRFDTARRILQTFARFVDRGMLPNVFPGDGSRPEYNTVDAALWYIEAWRAYYAASNDRGGLEAVFPLLREMVDWHVRGTRYGIAVDPADGLLRAGEPGSQITWMDAKIGDWAVTPRIGKPVEVNALWYNALETMVWFARQLRAEPQPYLELAAAARTGFARFVRPGGEGLFDVLDGPEGNDPTLRPNQVFAVSLPASPLDTSTQADVVACCARSLLTSYGLRSLDPLHPDFRGRYEGGVYERDSSYHRGPVWGWLLGHFALAEFRVHADPERAIARLDPVRDHLLDAGLGTVSEIFDGAPPHIPRGAPAQAWSVACTLESWCRLQRARQEQKTAPAQAAAAH